MLEDGLWSKFTFDNRAQHEEFADLLLMTALKAKKLSCDEDEYDVFEEFVFHNSDKQGTKFTAKRVSKDKEKEAKARKNNASTPK